MTEYPEIAARFEAETKRHEMTVLHDDGLYRHIRFARPKPESSAYWFDIVTWPGCLHIRGDVRNDYTFNRLPDMFEFFRNKRINAGYWAEKLDNGRPSVMEYTEAKLRQLVVECFVESARYDGVPRGTGKAIREQILNRDLEDPEYARALVNGFEFGPSWRTNCSCGDGIDVEDGTQEVVWRNRHMREFPGRDHRFTSHSLHRFSFASAWEWDTSDYSFEFLWACHAIVDGIRRYDAWRLTVPAHRPGMPTTYEYGGQTWELTQSYYDDCGEVWEHRGWWLGDVPLMWSVDGDGKPLHDPVPFGDAWRGDLQVWRSKP